MKNLIRKPVCVLILLGLIAPVGGAIQVINKVGFKTTFPFTVGNAKLPAGSYVIRQSETDEDLYEISSADGKTSALFEVVTAELPKAPSKSEVIFKKYDGNYVLSEIYEEGSKIGAMTIKSHAEKQQAKKSSAPTKESVATTKAAP